MRPVCLERPWGALLVYFDPEACRLRMRALADPTQSPAPADEQSRNYLWMAPSFSQAMPLAVCDAVAMACDAVAVLADYALERGAPWGLPSPPIMLHRNNLIGWNRAGGYLYYYDPARGHCRYRGLYGAVPITHDAAIQRSPALSSVTVHASTIFLREMGRSGDPGFHVLADYAEARGASDRYQRSGHAPPA